MRFASLVFAAALSAPGAAMAQQATDAQFASDVRALITTQLQALRGTDSAGFARTIATSIRTQFSDSDTLLGELSKRTPELADAEIVGFGELKQTRFGLTQLVRISDRTGHPWLAFFVVDREAGGEPAVKNLIVVKLAGQVI